MAYLTTEMGAMEDAVAKAMAWWSGTTAVAANRKETQRLRRCGGDDKVGDDGARRGGESHRDWSALPEPALYTIMEKKGLLPGALADLFSLGRVCKRWRSVFGDFRRERFSSMPPLLVDTTARCSSDDDGLGDGVYSLMEGRYFFRKEPYTWPAWKGVFPRIGIMTISPVSHGYFLVRGFTGLDVGAHDEVVFLMDPLADGRSPGALIHLPPQHPRQSLRSLLMTAPPTSPGCLIIFLNCRRLLFCRPGDTEWTTHEFCRDDGRSAEIGSFLQIGRTLPDGDTEFSADHAAVLDGKIYTLTPRGKLVIIESLLPKLRFTILEVDGLPLERGYVPQMANLVELDGEILFVVQVPEGGPRAPSWIVQRFVVYRLDLPARKWVTLNHLGGRTLFINKHGPSLTCDDAAKWGGARDSIYWVCWKSHRLLVFHMKDGRAEFHPTPEDFQYEWLIPSFCYN